MGNAARKRRDKEVACRIYKLMLSRNDETIIGEITSVPNWRDIRLGVVLAPQREWSVLHLAVWRGNCELAHLLLEAGMNPILPDYFGDTPYDLARELSDENMITLLGPLTAAEKSLAEKHKSFTTEGDLQGLSKTLHESTSYSMKLGTLSRILKDETGEATTKVRPV